VTTEVDAEHMSVIDRILKQLSEWVVLEPSIYVIGGILVDVGAEATLSDFTDFRVTHSFF
jgi:hypothetical protein